MLRYDLENHKWIKLDEIPRDPNHGLNGPVYCPEGGYFDMALNKKFESKEEKRQYMREKGLMMEDKYKPVDKRGTYYFIPGVKSCPKYYKNR